MKHHKLRIVLGFAGLIHAGVGVHLVEQSGDLPPIPAATPCTPATALDGAQALTLLSGVLGFGLAMGGLADRDDESGDAEPRAAG